MNSHQLLLYSFPVTIFQVLLEKYFSIDSVLHKSVECLSSPRATIDDPKGAFIS